WTKWTYEEALNGIQQAGYRTTGLLTATAAEPFTASRATSEYLENLRAAIKKHGLKPIMTALRTRHDISVADSVEDMKKQMDHANLIGVDYALTFGVDKPAQYEHYYQVMSEAAKYAASKNIKLVLKPHGGGSGAAEEILRCISKVNHPNFKIWYDAGNIIYYTGKDPVQELEPIVEHVTGFCAKDCAEPKGDVMIQFGTGKVDFKGVFARLKKGGFNGPIMVECAAGKTLEEVTNNARANREFLEKTLAEV
ncbi:MAG: family glycosyltransferase, partial [Verrucomicrobiales bacterium]|nr:family glycosyltransferase [Verrucomicrobiales bacterium]